MQLELTWLAKSSPRRERQTMVKWLSFRFQFYRFARYQPSHSKLQSHRSDSRHSSRKVSQSGHLSPSMMKKASLPSWIPHSGHGLSSCSRISHSPRQRGHWFSGTVANSPSTMKLIPGSGSPTTTNSSRSSCPLTCSQPSLITLFVSLSLLFFVFQIYAALTRTVFC